MENEYQSFIDDIVDIYNNGATRLSRYEESEDAPCLHSAEAALELLEKYTCGILDLLPKGMIIAGSTILKCLYKAPLSNSLSQHDAWEPLDVDFYIQTDEQGDIKAIVEEIDSLFRTLGETIIYKNSTYVITYVVRLKKPEFKTAMPRHFIAQLIIAPTTMDLLLASFHGDLVGAAYDTTTSETLHTEKDDWDHQFFFQIC
jgi:hypothetical protein